MRKIFIKFLIVTAFAVIVIMFFDGCSNKNQGFQFPNSTVENNNVVLEFLASCLNMPKKSILINTSTQEFYIPNTEFRMKIVDAQELYNSSVRYKNITINSKNN